MRNNRLDAWLEDPNYFSAMAVLSQGPLHPGGMMANALLAARMPWQDVDVLDIGAGTGHSHAFFASLGARVRSVEPNPWMRGSAMRRGIAESELFPLSAEELTSDWLELHCRRSRLLVQGVTGFLSGGLDTLAPILAHPRITEAVFVDWLDDRSDAGSAPVQHRHSAADYLAAVEAAGFSKFSLETFSYSAPANALPLSEAAQRVEWHFPEAAEIAWRDALPAKLSTVALTPPRTKPYLVLVAARTDPMS